jgi:hypothetical protein
MADRKILGKRNYSQLESRKDLVLVEDEVSDD